MRRRPTVYDVAARAGVSIATVSFAFTQPERVKSWHWCALDLEPGRVAARLRIGPLESEIGAAAIDGAVPVTLRVESRAPSSGGPDDIALGVGPALGDRPLAVFDGRYLSTEVATGFTGRVIGLQALAGAVTLHEVRYTATP
ncbi:hypothetical protein C1I99_06850 [Micromonospora deserti]|uniref:HTH lacI-type domain-containing protein n=2 Tax=Micromonospora deserti TaxID=2070366 RepID=A0A2W2DL01_9ACTN|nr:hypothetical protein C1I99_06850 [Micromonospora deserti]